MRAALLVVLAFIACTLPPRVEYGRPCAGDAACPKPYVCVDGQCAFASVPLDDEGGAGEGEGEGDPAGEGEDEGEGASEGEAEGEGECAQDADCDDGRFCTGVERCVRSTCVSSGVPCSAPASCSESDGACVGCDDDPECDDHVFCNGQEQCDHSGSGSTCRSGSAPCASACDESLAQCT